MKEGRSLYGNDDMASSVHIVDAMRQRGQDSEGGIQQQQGSHQTRKRCQEEDDSKRM